MAIESVLPSHSLHWPESIYTLRAAVTPTDEIYLVGGAVRDAFLGRPLHDIDLAVPGDGRPLARRIADGFGGAYYTLDSERGVGRAIIEVNQQTLTVDVAQFRGPDLLTDLRKRDFTLNAMAISLTGDLQRVFDPTGGLPDMERRILRRCVPESISSDPVRALRAIRTSVSLRLFMDPATRQDIRSNAELLNTCSPERLRDELFHILASPRPHIALDMMQRLGLLQSILPEIRDLVGLTQSAPHRYDAWRHTLATVEQLYNLMQVIDGLHDDNLIANFQLGSIVFTLADLREPLRTALSCTWPNKRSHRALLLLAALLHDIGKPVCRTIDDQGRIHFLGHDEAGAQIAYEWATLLRLSNDEAARLQSIVKHHMRPLSLSSRPEAPSRRAIYRYWRSVGDSGIDCCLLSLADYLATYGVELDTRAWLAYSAVIRSLLKSYLLDHATDIAPQPLLSGQTLIDQFGMSPGPAIGEILEKVREAQAIGEISTKKEALQWIHRLLSEQYRD